MDNQRLFLYMALGFIGLLLYQTWLADYAPVPAPAPTEQASTQPSEGGTDAATAPADLPAVPTQQETPVTGDAPLPTTTTASSTGERIRIDTPLVNAEIATSGGTIVLVTLDEYPVSIAETGTPFTLMSDDPARFLIAQSGLQGAEGTETPTHKSVYTSEQSEYTLAGDAEEGARLSVPLVWVSGGIKVTKTFHFYNHKYEIDVDYQIENNSGEPWQVSQYYQRVYAAIGNTG